MIDLILNGIVAVIVVSTFVIFPVVQAVRTKELAEARAPVWYQGKPLVMGLIGLFCVGLYLLMFMELHSRIDQTALRVIAAVLLALPTAVGFATLLALYHVLLWIRGR
jgi:uncharacterized membrane protein